MKKFFLFAITALMLGGFTAQAQEVTPVVKGSNQSEKIEKPKAKSLINNANKNENTQVNANRRNNASQSLVKPDKQASTNTNTNKRLENKQAKTTLSTTSTTDWEAVLKQYESVVGKLAAIAQAENGKKAKSTDFKTTLKTANELKMRLQQNEKLLNDKQIARRDEASKKLSKLSGVQPTRDAR